jgi:rhodanese-related sulfurtransferase
MKKTLAEIREIIATLDPVIIDVRPPQRFDAGHIEGAINVPLDDLDEIVAAELLASKDTPVVVNCQTGRHSAIAAERLAEFGYTNIYDLQGGYSAWSV